LIDYEQFCGVRGESAPPAGAISEITVEELKARLERGDDLFILDVRNPEEFQICRLEGSTLIPLPTLPQRVGELDRSREMVVHCKSGMRSQRAIGFLRTQGFTRLANLKGGILAWADRIDPSMPKY
jgi:adenylyltransferase/sulfurtransferase